MIWPPSNELGFPKGKITCIMSRPPEQLTPEDTKELSRRAKAELDRHGVEGVAARGTTEPTKSVTKGRVFIYQSGLGMQVRYRINNSSAFKLAYSEDRHGSVRAHFTGVLDLALKELTRLQVLDDLADVY